MKMNALIVASVFVTQTFFSCGAKEDDVAKEAREDSANAFGIASLQGVLRDKFTGERIALENENKKRSIYAVVKSKQMMATTQAPYKMSETELEQSKSLIGEYHLGGLPVDTEIPIIAQVDGYELFEGRAYIASTTKQRTPTTEASDITLTHPMLTADIELTPLGKIASDMVIEVEELLKDPVAHRPVAGAIVKVSLATRGNTTYSNENGYFKIHAHARANNIIGQTNNEGRMTISSNRLCPGETYTVEITPPLLIQSPTTTTFKVAHRVTEFGLETPSDPKEPNVLVIKVPVKQ